MLNIVIPMAGRGSRFANAGYTTPKPLIDVHGKPMIEYVSHNIQPKGEYRFIYICLEEQVKAYDLDAKLHAIQPNCEIVTVNQVTEGAACSVVLAEKCIDNADPMMIANSAEDVDVDINT